MSILVIVNAGLFGEALGQLVRELDVARDVRVQEGFGDGYATAFAAPRPVLVVVEADALGPQPEAALEAVRRNAASAPIVVVGGAAEAAQVPGACRQIARTAGSEEIAATLESLLHDASTAGRDAGPMTGRDAAAGPGAHDAGSFRGDAVPTFERLGLTAAETRVLAFVAQGLSNPEIALALGKAEGTVRAQVAAILHKLKVRNRIEAVVLASRIVAVVNAQIGRAEGATLDLAGLLPHLTHHRYRRGTVLFRKGDVGDTLYLIQRGAVSLPELGVVLGTHDTLGEIGLFTPDHRRTCSAVCGTDVALFQLDADQVKRAYFLNPAFAMHIVGKLAARLSADKVREGGL